MSPSSGEQLPPTWADTTGRDGFGLFATFQVRGVHQRMRWIPPGTFWMGSPENEEGRYDHEGPRRQVTLTRGFWLGDTPVTQALWQAVMDDNPSFFRDRSDASRRPVDDVTWLDARAFCERLSSRVPGPHAFRLPSEAEWERACRADADGPPWSGAGAEQALRAVAWFDRSRQDGTRVVAEMSPNPWGLYDMLGNIEEWCADAWHDDYRGLPAVDPVRQGNRSSYRVTRGGSWLGVAGDCRAAYRYRSLPVIPDDVGLRLARGPRNGAEPLIP